MLRSGSRSVGPARPSKALLMPDVQPRVPGFRSMYGDPMLVRACATWCRTSQRPASAVAHNALAARMARPENRPSRQTTATRVIARPDVLMRITAVALTVAFLVSRLLVVPVDAASRPACSFIGSEGDYIDRLKEEADAASDRGHHADAAARYEEAAEYAYSCVPHDIAEYIAGKPQALDVDTVKQSLWSNVGSLFEDAAKQARAAGRRARACFYSRRALEAYGKVPRFAPEMPKLRTKVKRGGC